VLRNNWEGNGEIQRILTNSLAEVYRMESISESALHDYINGLTDTVLLAKGYNTSKAVDIITTCRGLCGG